MDKHYNLNYAELMFLLDTVENCEAEIEQLELDHVWYSSDSRDKIDSAKEILRGHLGIKEIEDDEHGEEPEQATLRLL